MFVNEKCILMRKLSFILVLLLLSIYGNAQTSISGTVRDINSNEVLIGASIQVVGTTNGTITDYNGQYTIAVNPDASLSISYIGYDDKTIAVNGRENLDILLQATSKLLDEIVVVGYGIQKKSDVTGALVSFSAKDMNQTHEGDIANIIQGRAAGVSVVSSSGAPGRDTEINIRGISSINGSPPLWIVDGVPTSGGVNPQDIESMEILKDASSTAIYGTKGANGVILITTKKGKKGKMVSSYENRFTSGSMYKQLNLATAEEWAKYRSEAYNNASLPVPNSLKEISGIGTNWQDEITRTSLSQNHHLSFSGGSDKMNWMMSGNYYDDQGIINGSDASGVDLRINSSAKVNNWLRVGENFSIGSSKTHLVNEEDEWNSIMIEAIAMDPVTKPRKENGDWEGSRYNAVNNPVAHLDRTKDEGRNIDFGGNVFAEISFLKDFVFTSRLGYHQVFSNDYSWTPTFFVKTGEENAQTSVSRDFYEGKDWVSSNFLTWGNDFGKHGLKAMIGMEAERNQGEWVGVTANDLISEEEHLVYISNATGNQLASAYGLGNDIRYTSYFGRINYDYNGKYFLTTNFRRQGSSMFGPDNRWGNFPSTSIGWRIDKEGFMDNMNSIDILKLRVGYGITGSDLALEPYSYYATSQSGERYVINNAIVDGVTFPVIPNTELHWEEKTAFNVGVDLDMYDNKLSFSGDFFVSETGEMLYDPDLPGHVGTENNPFTNIASMKNTGFEFILGYRNKINELKYDLKFNFSHVNNKVLNLGSAQYIPAVTFMQLGFISHTEVGHPMASFYGYLTDGIFQNQGEVDAHTKPDGAAIQPNAAPGDIRYIADENGELVLDFLGNPFPDFTAGFNANLNFKGFNLLAFFYGVYGNEIFNATKFFTHNSSVRYNVSQDYKDRWLIDGDTNDPNLARVNLNDANNGLRSDRFVEDGSYLRLKTLKLEYSIPESLFSKIGISEFNIFIGADNLVTLTNYTGFDPEVGIGYNNNPLDRGIDRARYPSPRTYFAGFHLNF